MLVSDCFASNHGRLLPRQSEMIQLYPDQETIPTVRLQSIPQPTIPENLRHPLSRARRTFRILKTDDMAFVDRLLHSLDRLIGKRLVFKH